MGRQTELRSVIDGLLAATSRGVVIVGPAGVGKSRLAEEALSEARAGGWDVEAIFATTSTQTVPFGAFAHLSPDPDHALAGPQGSPMSRTRLLAESARAINRRAESSPTIIAVDDAHLLDEGSASVLHAVGARGAARLLLTVRSGAAVPGAVTALWKEGRLHRLDLAPLRSAASDELTAAFLGGTIDTATGIRLFTLSGGQPLFLIELLKAGLASGALTQAECVWRWSGPAVLSDRLATIIGARLDRITVRQRRLLEAVAVSEPVAVGALRPWGDVRMVEDLELAGLLRSSATDGVEPQVRLGHPLYGELLRDQLPALVRRRLLATLAGELAAGAAPGRDDWFKVAIWTAESGGTVEPDVLVWAALRAMALFAHDLAVTLARRAIELGAGAAGILVLGRALYWLGRYEECDRALAVLAPGSASEVEMADAANIQAAALFWGLDEVRAALERLETWAAILTDSQATAILKSQEATLLVWSGHPEEGEAIAAGVVTTPGADAPASLRATIALALAASVDGQTDAAVGLASGAVELAFSNAYEIPLAAGELLAVQASACWLGGKLAEAADLAGLASRWCIEHDEESMRGIFVLIEGQSALGRGDMTTAIRLLREASACLQGADPGRAAAWASAALAAALAQSGDGAGAAEAAIRARSLVRRSTGLLDPLVVWGEAWAAAVTASTSVAVGMLIAAADACAGRAMRAVEVFLLVDATRLGGARAAAKRLGPLAEGLRTPSAMAALDLARGVATSDAGLLSVVSERFAVDGAGLQAAEAAMLASHAHAQAGTPKAAASLANRARTLLDACPGADPPTVAFAQAAIIDPLTPREREVAQLAARGLSNPDVARRLGLSVRTVENHLARAYTKLGIQRRRELASIFGWIGRKPPE